MNYPKELISKISRGRALISARSSLSTTTTQWPKLTLFGDLDMRPFRNVWMLEEIQRPYLHIQCKPWSRVAKSVHPLGKVPALLVEHWRPDNEVLDGTSDGDTEEGKKCNSFVVLESAAINTFLGDMAREFPSDSAMPCTLVLVPPPATLQRAKYDMLSMFVMTEIDSQSLWIERKHGQLPEVFGDAPVAVKEARRQFKNALNVMVNELISNNHGFTEATGHDDGPYLLSTGFSAVDILFAHCCFWAQQIGWLEKKSSGSVPSSSLLKEGATVKSQDNEVTTNNNTTPLALELSEYLDRCRSRPAFQRAKDLRRNQVDDSGRRTKSKL